MLQKLKKLFQKKESKSSFITDYIKTETDRELENNDIRNKKISIGSIATELDSQIVYYNQFNQLITLETNREMRSLIERELSCMKILIESNTTTQFLDSLDFFQKINNECRNATKEIRYLYDLFLFESENDSDPVKIYFLISGSVGDYIAFLEQYMKHYANKNDLIVGIIMKHLRDLPAQHPHFQLLNETYDLDIASEIYYGDDDHELFPSESIDPQFQTVMSKLKSSTVGKDRLEIIQTTTLKNDLDFDMPKRYRRILDLFIKKELEHKKFNVIFYYCPSDEEHDVFLNGLQLESIGTTCSDSIEGRVVPYIYQIDFSKLYYQLFRLPDTLAQIFRAIQDQNSDKLKQNSFIYYKNEEESEDDSTKQESTPLNILDLVDEIIEDN
ncbi:MAG: hypothetical protein PHC62_00770 [Candidatus Izemoplasmatales bacterium]|nr:hypothetical protein [Candidatus Izemoplasmatales bacterium]